MGNTEHKEVCKLPNPVEERYFHQRGADQSRRVLLIEDNLGIATGMRILLERLGHVVHTAHTGPEGLRQARLLLPDVVVSDIGLPDMNGYDIARRLSADARTCSIKLVAMTGYGFSSFAKQAREAGFDCFLAKPVSVEAMRDALRSLDESGDEPVEDPPPRDFCLSLRH